MDTWTRFFLRYKIDTTTSLVNSLKKNRVHGAVDTAWTRPDTHGHASQYNQMDPPCVSCTGSSPHTHRVRTRMDTNLSITKCILRAFHAPALHCTLITSDRARSALWRTYDAPTTQKKQHQETTHWHSPYIRLRNTGRPLVGWQRQDVHHKGETTHFAKNR